MVYEVRGMEAVDLPHTPAEGLRPATSSPAKPRDICGRRPDATKSAVDKLGC